MSSLDILLLAILAVAIVLTLWIVSDLDKAAKRQRARARHRVDPDAMVRISEGFAALQAQMVALNKATRRAGEAMLSMRDAIVRAIDEEAANEVDCSCKPGAPAHRHGKGGYADI